MHGLERTFIWKRVHFVRGSCISGGVFACFLVHAFVCLALIGCVEPFALVLGDRSCFCPFAYSNHFFVPCAVPSLIKGEKFTQTKWSSPWVGFYSTWVCFYGVVMSD